MVGCLRALTTGPRRLADLEETYTGWSVKALLRRGYVVQYSGDGAEWVMMMDSGLAALHLEENGASPKLGGSTAEERPRVAGPSGG